MGHSQNENQFFDRINKNRSSPFRNILLHHYNHVFWLSYKSFSNLGDAFCQKKGSFPAKIAGQQTLNFMLFVSNYNKTTLFLQDPHRIRISY